MLDTRYSILDTAGIEHGSPDAGLWTSGWEKITHFPCLSLKGRTPLVAIILQNAQYLSEDRTQVRISMFVVRVCSLSLSY